MRKTYYAGPVPNKGVLVFTAPDTLAALAFLVVVRGPAARAILRLSSAEPVLIGSTPALNHFALDDEALSSQQFSVRYQDGAFFLTNLDPSKQVKINGEPVDRRRLQHHDVITLGRTHLIFCEVQRETLAQCGQ